VVFNGETPSSCHIGPWLEGAELRNATTSGETSATCGAAGSIPGLWLSEPDRLGASHVDGGAGKIAELPIADPGLRSSVSGPSVLIDCASTAEAGIPSGCGVSSTSFAPKWIADPTLCSSLSGARVLFDPGGACKEPLAIPAGAVWMPNTTLHKKTTSCKLSSKVKVPLRPASNLL
jgi:hypothetical protein